jgi:N-acetylmuramoyl-L-alanine amidase
MKRNITAFVVVFALLIGITMLVPIDNVEASTSTPVLKVGEHDGYVWDLQHRLQQLGFYKHNLDGVFGRHTELAVIQLQTRYGLSIDGQVGHQTWRTLRNVTYTANEIEMLAKLIHGEARGESFEGKVAVASVVLNRLKSSTFPNTIKGVIFEPRAFTAINDGQYYTTPDRDSYRAAYHAIRGWDPTSGALYYFNPDTATSDWIWSRPQIKKIDQHIFAR